MEFPFIVSYDDGYWLHDNYSTNSHLQHSIFDRLAKGAEKMQNLTPVCGESYHREIIKTKKVMRVTYSDTSSTQPHC